MMDERRDEAMLAALFAQARTVGPEPSDGLMARVIADAEAVQALRRKPVAARPGPFASALAALGGWGAVSGLVAATLTGVWIGIAGVGGLGSALTGASGAETVTLFPDETEFFALSGGWEGLDG